jgi:trans-aconitate methyltransferase
VVHAFTLATVSAVAGQYQWDPETYLEQIRTEVPRFDEIQRAAVEAVPSAPERVLELGMGTGETTRVLLESHPDAWVIGLDSSPEMVFRLREEYDGVMLARMEDPLPDGPWDLVIAVLSVGALSDELQQALFRRVREQAKAFVVADAFDDPDRIAEWCGGEVTWRADDLAVVRATYA